MYLVQYFARTWDSRRPWHRHGTHAWRRETFRHVGGVSLNEGFVRLRRLSQRSRRFSVNMGFETRRDTIIRTATVRRLNESLDEGRAREYRPHLWKAARFPSGSQPLIRCNDRRHAEWVVQAT
jgi:hypothetical protein